jgi:DNA-binding NarL/FixJ family response regulator
MKTRIFVLEDHPSMRENIARFVSGLPDMEVCGSAATAEDALAKLADANADLVLVDVSLPTMSGLDFLREARERWPQLRCLVLSGHDETAYLWRAFSLGAQGYVAKGNAEQLRVAIGCVLRGETFPQSQAKIKPPARG